MAEILKEYFSSVFTRDDISASYHYQRLSLKGERESQTN